MRQARPLAHTRETGWATAPGSVVHTVIAAPAEAYGAGQEGTVTDQLTALDATFLELEEADDSAHMHIGALLVFAGAAPTTEQATAHLEERLGALPRYRQKLSEPRT